MSSGGYKASHGYKSDSSTPKTLSYALTLLGTTETKGSKPNPDVQEFFKATDPDGKMFGKKPDTKAVPWCAIFINHVLKHCGFSGTGSAMARSFLKWGDEVCALNGRGTVTSGSWDAIRPGDICVIWRGSRNDGITGHVFFATTVGKTWVEGVGGNQGDSVTIQRFAKSKMLGVRRPRSALKKESVVTSIGGAVSGAASKVAEHVIPDASTVDRVAQAAEQAKGPLADLATFKPWITGVLAVMSIALIAYGVYKATRNVQQRS